jgi:hypothetical protein
VDVDVDVNTKTRIQKERHNDSANIKDISQTLLNKDVAILHASDCVGLEKFLTLSRIYTFKIVGLYTQPNPTSLNLYSTVSSGLRARMRVLLSS